MAPCTKRLSHFTDKDLPFAIRECPGQVDDSAHGKGRAHERLAREDLRLACDRERRFRDSTGFDADFSSDFLEFRECEPTPVET